MNTIAPRPVDAVIAAVREFLGDRLSTAQAIREQHSRGEDQTPPTLPDAVAYVETTEEVSRILALCHRHEVPVVAFGAGTSLEGHVNPVRRGISLDLSRMTTILEVNAEDMDCLIEPGVTRQQLNDHLRDQGMFFPVDPGSVCTIGGMCATRASGTNAVRYGTIRENVLGLEVVLADGRVIKTGGRARKGANGYDLTRLFIGSEGTLGIITKVRLRLHGIPEAQSAAICQFPDLESAVNTTIATMQTGIPVARIELLDADQMEACIKYSKLEGLRATPTLFLEFHGTHAAVKEQAEGVEAIATDFGGEGFSWATEAEARNKLWKARHDAYWAGIALIPGCAASPPMSASPSASWPRRSSAPRRTRWPPASPPASSGMWGTAISTRSSCSTRTTRRRSTAPGSSTARSSRAAWRSAGHVRASMAWASASANSSRPSMAPRPWR